MRDTADVGRRPGGGPAVPASGVTERSGRLGWVDAGRGIAILLVVLLHAEDWLGKAGMPLPAWDLVNDVFGALRMPLFFSIAGLLGAGWLRRPWRDLLSRKVTLLVWVYLVWQPMGMAASLLADRFTGGHSSVQHVVTALAATPLRPRSELWFLWALAVYFVLARAGRRWPLWPQLVVAGAASAVWLSDWGPQGNTAWDGVPKYFLFFLVAARRPQAFTGFVDRIGRRPLRWAPLVAVGLGSAAWVVTADLTRWPGLGLADRVLGLGAGLVLAVWLARTPGVSQLVRALGKRTLQIYVVHVPLIVALAGLLHPYRDAGPVHTSLAVGPVLLTGVVVPLALGIHALAVRSGARWLYAPPDRLTRRLSRRARADRGLAGGPGPSLNHLRK